MAPPANAQTAIVSSTSSIELYHRIGQTFWDAEKQLQQRGNKFALWNPAYQSPLAKSDALFQKYFYVDKAAGKYLTLIDTENPQSWTLPPVLYLGGLAAFTIGDYANAEKYFSRLLHEYPDYKRNLYINDRDAPDPDFAQPVKPGISKLLFYCQIVGARGGASTKPSPTGRGLGEGKDAFATFQQFNQTATKVLLTQAAFAQWLKTRPHQYQRRDFYIDESYGETPDQMRATVLPKTAQLIQDGWEQLFPGALKKSGSLKMRGYLRELTKEDAPLKDIAAPRLVDVDQRLIKYYFAQAKVLLRQHNFAATRKMYRRITAEYPSSPAAQRAEEELPRVVPVAIKFYKTEGTKNFHPEKHVGVPQSKARGFFEKMYSESTKNGITESADYALYYWARSLGTEGKFKEALQKLHGFEDRFPRSRLRSKALFLEGFLNGDPHVNRISLAAKLMEQVAQRYQNSEDAAEAALDAFNLMIRATMINTSFQISDNCKYDSSGKCIEGQSYKDSFIDPHGLSISEDNIVYFKSSARTSNIIGFTCEQTYVSANRELAKFSVSLRYNEALNSNIVHKSRLSN